MPNNEPLLITEAGVAYLATQLKAYTDAKVAEAQQTAVMRSGSKWKDLVDAINAMLGTSFGYDADLDDITDALSAYEPNTLPTGIELWDGSTAASIVDILQYPERVKSISLPVIGAFYGMADMVNLQSVNLPYVTKISLMSFYNNHIINYVSLPNLTTIPWRAFNGTWLTKIELPMANTIPDQDQLFANNPYLEQIFLNSFSYQIAGSIFQNCPSLKHLYAPNCMGSANYTTWNGSTINMNSLTMFRLFPTPATPQTFPSSYVYRIHLTENITTTMNLSTWNPIIAILTTDDSLVPQQEWDLERDEATLVDCTGFSNNQEKFLYFFKNVFMPSFATVTSATLTLKSTIYDVITTDTDITSYFSSHGWTLARLA